MGRIFRARSFSTIWICLLSALPWWRALALDPQKAITQFTHRKWGAADGIMQVSSICQTSDGYIWIATLDGLFRFDGAAFVHWEPGPGQHRLPGIPDQLLATPDGGLCVAGTGHVTVFRNGKEEVHVLRNNEGRARIGRVCGAPDGTLWIGTSIGLCQIKGGEARWLGREWGLPEGPVDAPMIDREKTLWVSVDKPGSPEESRIAFLRNGETRFHLSGALSRGTAKLALAPDGKIWAAETSRSVRPFTVVQNEIRYGGPEIHVGSSCVLSDRDGSLWISTFGDGLRRIRNTAALGTEDIGQFDDSVDKFTVGEEFSSDFAVCLFEDREGVVWCGTSAGLDCFCENKVSPITTREGLPFEGNLAVLATKEGGVWVGSSIHGFMERKPGQKQFVDRKWVGLDGSGCHGGFSVFSLYEDNSGNLIFTTGCGIALLKQGESQASFLPEFMDLKTVLAVTSDPEGGLWFCDRYKGVQRLFHGEVRQFPELHREADGWASVAHTDRTGRVWIGLTTGEVALHEEGGFRVFSEKDGLSAGQVTGIFDGGGGDVWVASGGGLSRYREGHFQTLSRKDGLPFDDLFAALADDNGALWLAGAPGVLKVTESDLANALAGKAQVTGELFTQEDGLRGMIRHTPFGSRSFGTSVASKAPDGRLWFATSSGLAVIDPRGIPRNTIAPPVHVQKVTVKEKSYSDFNALTFPSGTRDCKIDFVGLSYSNPFRVRYRYKLDGIDPDWRYSLGDRQATYSNLKPGHYRFQVCACNGDGVWNDTGDTLRFGILPAFYETAWFSSACVVAGGLGLFGLHRYRLSRLAAQATLQARLARATQVASFAELAASIAHEINQPLAAVVTNGRACLRWLDRAVPDLDEARKAAQNIVADGNRGSEVVSRIRALLKKEPPRKAQVSLNGVIREIVHLAGIESQGIALEQGLADDLPLVLVDRVQLQQVLFNLIVNALDAMKPVTSRARVLRIATEKFGEEQVLVTVEDTGIGLDPRTMEHLFDTFYTTKAGGLGLGLSISHTIIEAHGGKLWAGRKETPGAVFHFTLPARKGENP